MPIPDITVTQEVHERLAAYNKQVMFAAEIQAEELRKIANKKGDTRAMLGLAPFMLDPTKSMDDPQTQEEFRAYVRDYASGDPAKRKPYLDKMFDTVEQMRADFDYTDAQQLTDNCTKAIRMGQFATYCENMKAENADYYNRRYGANLAKAEQLEMAMLVNNTVAAFGMQVLSREGYLMNDASAIPASRENDNEYILAKGQVDIIKSKQQAFEAVRAGKELPAALRLEDETFWGHSACSIGKEFGGKNMPGAEACQAANNVFATYDYLFEDTPQVKAMRAKAGLGQMDMIFIDGVSAAERFKEKYKGMADDNLREQAIKGEVLAALSSGRQRVEIANVTMDSNNEPKVALQSLSLDVSKTQPDKKEEYGWIRRHLFDWGPGKCKSRQERIDELASKDVGKDERQQAILAKLQPAVKEAHKQQEQEWQDKAKEAMQAQIAKEKPLLITGDMREKLEVQCFGHISDDEAERTSYFKRQPNEREFLTLGRGVSRLSLANLVLLDKGYDIEEIFTGDSEQLRADRAEAGRTITDLFDGPAEDRVKFSLHMMDMLAQQRLPDCDLSDIRNIASYERVHLLGIMTKDLEQSMGKTTRNALTDALDPEQISLYTGTLSVLGRCGVSMGKINEYVQTKLKPGDNNVGAYNVACDIQTMREFGETLRGKTMAELLQKDSGFDPAEFILRHGDNYSSIAVAANDNREIEHKVGAMLLGGPVIQVEKQSDGYIVEGCKMPNNFLTTVEAVRRDSLAFVFDSPNPKQASPRTPVAYKELQSQEGSKQNKHTVQQTAANRQLSQEKKADGPDRQ